MPRVRDLLYRLRPAGAPGAATAAGVPSQASRDREQELEPVFALLEPTERACDDVVAGARAEADRLRQEARARAGAALADARACVAAERAAAGAAVRDAGLDVARDEERAVAAEVAALRVRAADVVPVHVEAVLAAVRRGLATGEADGAEGGT